MKSQKLIIVHRAQFGYHTDVYKWCEYLHDSYQIELICFDEGRKRYQMNNVSVHYSTGSGGKVYRWICFMLLCLYRLCFFKGLIIVSHFKGSALLKRLLPWKKMILDIRTFSVNPDVNIRKIENEKLFESVKRYDFVTVISEGLRRQLPKDDERTAVLPLGGDVIKLPVKSYENLDLLYVGTFFNRNLEDTIKGFMMACRKRNDVKMRYHIVGGGIYGEDAKLKSLTSELGLEDKVFFYGKQPHDQLDRFFEMCNIGVSYVPIMPYYEHQPVTKTYEYIMSGLYTIATATASNKEVVTEENGCLIDDNADAFCNGIIKIVEMRDRIDDNRVRYSLADYNWENIVSKKMKPMLEDIHNRFLA